MALGATMVAEVRTGGSDNNGGGYASDAGTTDYSLQDASQLALSDLATSGIGVTTLTSATGGFTAAMVGNVIQIRSGTNVTAGFYKVTARTDTNTVTLDRAPDDGVGGIASGVGDLGGALATPGALSDFFDTSLQQAWIATGTYTLSTGTIGPGGPLNTPSTGEAFLIRGYNTTRGDLDNQLAITNKPVIDAGTNGSITVLDMDSAGVSIQHVLSSVVVDGNSQSSVTGINNTGNSDRATAICCHVRSCTTGFGALITTIACEADDCTTGFGNFDVFGCVAHDGVTGFSPGNGALFRQCMAYDNSGDGFTLGNRSRATNCLSHSNGGDGFDGNGVSSAAWNCLSTNNTGYGFRDMHVLMNSKTYSNTAGTTTNVTREIGVDELTSDPYVNAGTLDLRPNDTAGGGADVRAAAMMFPTQTNNHDIGGLQHADPVGGATTIITRPRRQL